MLKQSKKTLKLIKGLGITAILLVLTLGVTDAVSAQEDRNIHSSVFFDNNSISVLNSGRPLLIVEEEPAADLQERWVSGPVPLYSQLDNFGTEWTSCGPTTLAMALNYSMSGPTPQEIIEYAVKHRGKDGTPLYKPRDPEKIFTSPQNLYEMAERFGLPQAGWITDEEEAKDRLRVLLNKDLPVIVDVTVSLSRDGSNAAHFVLVTGISTDNTVTIHDPYGAGLGAQVRQVSWDDFYWAWQNNSDGYIGGSGWWMVVRSDRPLSVG